MTRAIAIYPSWLSRIVQVCLVGAIATAGLGMVSPLSAISAASTVIAQANSIRPTLRLGSTGTAVSELQAMLALLGYFKDPVDGKFQATTESAVKKFQQDIGLTSDGIVGPATWERLLPSPSTDLNPPPVPVATPAPTTPTPAPTTPTPPPNQADLPTLRKGMTGTAVARIQETLKARGFYDGPIDGAFGPATEDAVRAFQRSVQLVDDGVVGPATWQALLR